MRRQLCAEAIGWANVLAAYLFLETQAYVWWLRALGVHVGDRCHIASALLVGSGGELEPDLLFIGDDCLIESGVNIATTASDDGELFAALPVFVGARTKLLRRSRVAPGAELGSDVRVAPLSLAQGIVSPMSIVSVL